MAPADARDVARSVAALDQYPLRRCLGLIRRLTFEIACRGPGIDGARAVRAKMHLCLRRGADGDRQRGDMKQIFHSFFIIIRRA